MLVIVADSGALCYSTPERCWGALWRQLTGTAGNPDCFIHANMLGNHTSGPAKLDLVSLKFWFIFLNTYITKLAFEHSGSGGTKGAEEKGWGRLVTSKR